MGSGEPFNDAYRYVDWLPTVPLLLIELILVMGLPAEQTASLGWKLGVSSGLMVALGSVLLCSLHSGGWFGGGHSHSGGVCSWPHWGCTVLDSHLLVDLPRCLHHQDGWHQWSNSNISRTDRLFHC